MEIHPTCFNLTLKQHYVTLTATRGFQKTKLNDAHYYVAQNSNFSETGHIL